MVAQRPLEPLILVRVRAPQLSFQTGSEFELDRELVYRAAGGQGKELRAGVNPTLGSLFLTGRRLYF